MCKHEKSRNQLSFYFNQFPHWMNRVKHSFSLWVSLKIHRTIPFGNFFILNLHLCSFDGCFSPQPKNHKKRNICLNSSSEILEFSKLPFPMFKNSSPSHFWQAPTHTDITEFENFLLQLENQRSGSENVYGFFIILILKGIMTL